MPTTMVHPPLLAGNKHPLLIFAHGRLTNPANYTQLFDQLASMGFVVAAPQSDPNTFCPLGHGANVLALAQNLHLNPTYGPFLDGRLAMVGYSIGGGAVLHASAQIPTQAVVGLAPYNGLFFCQGEVNTVHASTSNVQAPVLFLQGQSDTLSGQGPVMFPLLNSSRRMHAFLRIQNADHGSPGYANVSAGTNRANRVLQDRTFRYLQAFLSATVFDSPLNPVPEDLAATGAGFDVLVGQPGLDDQELSQRTVNVTDPDLYLLSDGPTGQGLSLSLGMMGQANSFYLWAMSLSPTGSLNIPGLGAYLLDPSFHITFNQGIPSGQLNELFFLVTPPVLGNTIHVQGLGIDHSGQARFTTWRRSVSF